MSNARERARVAREDLRHERDEAALGSQTSRLPEWFIGGPLDGENKLTTCPDNGSHEVRTVQYNLGGQLDDSPVHTAYSYRRTRFALGRTTLTLWVLYGMDHLDVGDRLAEILLAPHLTEAP